MQIAKLAAPIELFREVRTPERNFGPARLSGGITVTPLARRLAAYQRAFAVPRPRLQAAFTRAIEVCRERTRQFLVLPPGETISVEYVADKPWSGYSVYLGRYRSVFQVNRVLSHSVDDVLTLA